MRDCNSTRHQTPSEASGNHSQISQGDLLRMLNYDPGTGDFKWIQHQSKPDLIGRSAGSARKDAVAIKVNGVRYRAHRLAWLYMTGEWPYDVIDHVDGNPMNNVWSNLRSVDRSVNAQNRRSRSATKAGETQLGVYMHKKSGKYQASITVTLAGRKMQLYLGLYDAEDEAYAVYVDAKRFLHDGSTL